MIGQGRKRSKIKFQRSNEAISGYVADASDWVDIGTPAWAEIRDVRARDIAQAMSRDAVANIEAVVLEKSIPDDLCEGDRVIELTGRQRTFNFIYFGDAHGDEFEVVLRLEHNRGSTAS